MITMYPTMFEAVDEMGDTVFHIKCFDEAVSSISIEYTANAALWDEIAPLVRQALVAIHGEKK